MKTILFVDHTARLGGGEVALLNLVSTLDDQHFRPVVVLASDGPLVSRLRAAGIETHIAPLSATILETRKDNLNLKSLLRFRQAWACVEYAFRIANLARRLEADLIHTNSLKADLYGGVAGRLAGIPVIWHVRDNIAAPYLPAAVAGLFRALCHSVPRMVIVNSESTLRTLRASGRRFQVVYDGCDARKYETATKNGKENVKKDGGPVIALVGRIAGWKGQHVFIDAASIVRKRFSHARFQIIGAPLFGELEYERSLHRKTQESNLTDRVEFLGFRDDVPSLMAQADILVHASTIGEPFGQVIIEAMAAGKPVIATDGGAVAEIVVPGKTGLLVAMGSASAMADAIMDLLAAPDRAVTMGAAGRARVENRFTIAQTARRVEEVYSCLLEPCGTVPQGQPTRASSHI